jgi:hypothetical protein
MYGGAVSGNNPSSSSLGGGVYVNTGTFTMNGGTVSGNSLSSTYSRGGGVYVNTGTFNMNGGAISGHTLSSSSSNGGGVYVYGGRFTMSGGAVSGNSVSSYGGGVYTSNSGTFTMNGGTVSGNSASLSGGGVYTYGTFTKQPGAIIYGSNESNSALKNTVGNNGEGDAVFLGGSPAKRRYTTAGVGITLDNSKSGSAGGWEERPSSGISNIAYSSVSGSALWTLESDGRRRSPVISHNITTKTRVNFTAAANASITITLDVSSESYDYAFISTMDNANTTYDNGYYTGSRISGTSSTTSSVTVTIPVSTAGSHFIDICYRKDESVDSGSDCAWFKVIE